MDIVIFGANGPTGRLAVEQGLAAGHRVTAVTRRPQEFPFAGPALRVVGADVHDADAVAKAVDGQEAVVSVLGVPFGRKPVDVYSVGVRHIAAAMRRAGVRRLVVVTSTTVSGEESPGEGWFFRKLLEPFVAGVVGRTVYDDMRRAEELVRACGLDWTIVRPAGLFDTEGVSDYRLEAGPRLPGRFTSRADLADALLRLATEDAPDLVRTSVEVRTVQGVPTLLQLLRKEAFGK
ncbi:NAD(P)-dependent oxidoreductase [Streptacidiphilus monticola]|jgi:uncharacterized protein YbjT (DUF2867 family)|uniref:NAD(P)-dependent oxidoreductase n=1 Tax=Streptacidiphilus monticola TaxID=2161674 RepID=A0ABW1G8E8_9ACTN